MLAKGSRFGSPTVLVCGSDTRNMLPRHPNSADGHMLMQRCGALQVASASRE